MRRVNSFICNFMLRSAQVDLLSGPCGTAGEQDRLTEKQEM